VKLTELHLQTTYLQVPNGSTEWIVSEATFFVQELASLAIDRWAEEAIIEALFQLLQHVVNEQYLMILHGK
jgi:hypothetical protein